MSETRVSDLICVLGQNLVRSCSGPKLLPEIASPRHPLSKNSSDLAFSEPVEMNVEINAEMNVEMK